MGTEEAKSSGVFRVIASFVSAQGEPVGGNDYMVKLYDKDPLFDDFLASGSLSNEGSFEAMIFVDDIVSLDSLNERNPDLYFILEQNGKEIFRSETFADVNFEQQDDKTKQFKSLTRSFGPFELK